MVPTSTGAAIATTQVIPELEGIFNGMAIRVPIPVVSLVDFTFLLNKEATVEQVNNAFKRSTKHPFYKGVVEVTDEPLVSSDFIGSTASAVIDLGLTIVVGGDLVKVVAWYDNEWGYSYRLAEMALIVGKNIK